jgi:hypothetical protein
MKLVKKHVERDLSVSLIDQHLAPTIELVT